MTVCAAVSGAQSPSRLARRGEARLDIIVMILVIVAVLGMGTWAFVAYGAYVDDEPVVVRMENAPVALEAEYRSLLATADAAPAALGHASADSVQSQIFSFTGDANNKFPIPAERPAYFNPAAGAVSVVLDRNSGVSVDDNGKFTGAELVTEAYVRNDVTTLVGLIDAQHRRINTLLDAISVWGDIHKAESAKTKQAYDAYVARAKQFVDVDTKEFFNTMDARLKAAVTTHVAAVNEEADELAQTNVTLSASLDSLNAARNTLAEQRAKVGPAMVAAALARDEAWNLAAQRAEWLAANKDFSGFVEQVDPKSGYVWINLGQLDNVRREMSFQVFTPTATGTATVLIGELRIKDVLGEHLSRCRIDYLKDDKVLPKVGDYIKNTNFARNPYKLYSFVGDFGGSNSKYSKQQLTDMLQGVGLTVRAPSRDIEVVVIGNNHQNDPAFRKLKEDGVVFASMTERDLLYMLGISRTD